MLLIFCVVGVMNLWIHFFQFLLITRAVFWIRIELMEVKIRFSWFFIIVFLHLLKCEYLLFIHYIKLRPIYWAIDLEGSLWAKYGPFTTVNCHNTQTWISFILIIKILNWEPTQWLVICGWEKKLKKITLWSLNELELLM